MSRGKWSGKAHGYVWTPVLYLST